MLTENQLIKLVLAISVTLVTFDIAVHNLHGQQSVEPRFLNEDQSMVCKHEMHLGYGNSTQLSCVTVQDDQMDYEIFERLMTDSDTYGFD